MSAAATAGLRLVPRRFSRGRLLAFHLLEGAAAALGGRAFYRRTALSPGRLRVRRERLAIDGLPTAFQGLRIVQLSDPHAGPFLGRGDLAHAVDAVLALAPDLVVLTGDLITHRTEEAFELIFDLARIRARLGKFAVFGNHDYRGRREHEIAARFEREAGFVFLRDSAVRFAGGERDLVLVGLEDVEEARAPDAQSARAGSRESDIEVVLCHNPAAAPWLARAGCALILCGHTHGHQIDLPGIRALAPPHPGDRVQHGATAIITSRGLGALGVPLRVRSPAEIVCVELVDGSGGIV